MTKWFWRKTLVILVVVLFLLTSLSSVYAGTVFNELKCLDDEVTETAMSTIEKITDRESILDKYDLSKISFKHLNDRIRKPTLIDGEEGYWDIIVPDDYQTIQEAIDHATAGYRIFVRSGTYEENIATGWSDCSVTLHGENKDTTYIIGDGSDHVISISGESKGVNISGFTIENSGEGYAGAYLCSDYHILQGNVFQSNSYGIKISEASGNIVQGNVMIDNTDDGVVLDDYSYGNTIEENYISGNYDGVMIDRFSTFNVISGNVVEENMGCGLRVDDVSRSTMIIWNTIRGNSIGVDCSGVSDGIFAHHNMFIDNDVNAFDNSLGQWDSGTAGNYWSDYTGVDSDGDGIGDEPYNIPGGNNSDNHPLMSPSLYDCSLKQTLTIKECFQNADEQDHKQSTVSFDGDTIVVPDDYPTIQEALDNAVDGDTVFVRGGTYREHVSVVKCVRIIGENASCTIVDGKRMDYHVFAVFADGVELSGFTIRHSSIGFSGVRVYGNNCNICNNILKNCGGGVELWTTSDTVVNSNTMTNNVWGIYIHFSENCDILNNSIKNNTYGIELGVSPINISGNIIENNSLNGILCLWSFNCFIDNNSIFFNDDMGIQMFSSDNNSVKDNIIKKNQHDGISIHKSINNTFTDNIISENLESGVSFWYRSKNNQINKNKIKSNGENGVSLYNWCNNNSIANSTINSNNDTGILFYVYCNYNTIIGNNISSNLMYGITLGACDYNHIINNTITFNGFLDLVNLGFGIFSIFAKNNIISNNVIKSNVLGIGLIGNNNKITGNTIDSNKFGGIGTMGPIFPFYFNFTSNNTISKNTITNNGLFGIVFGYSSYHIISENTITNHLTGISLFFSSHNIISENTITNHITEGITLDYSSYNNVNYNNFIKNLRQATFCNAFSNNWSNNYWSNWKLSSPKPILGKIKFSISIPWIAFDYYPAEEPYDIGG